MSSLRIGIPSQGRLAEPAEQLLREAGLHFRRQDGSLFARCSDPPVDITYLRVNDIPVLCAEGAIDLGITGDDLLAESGAEVIRRLELGIGGSRMAVCVPEYSGIATPSSLAGRRIATRFPNVTSHYLQQQAISAHLVTLSGSVEIMISLGVADAIVDLIDTGGTLAANRLQVLDEIGRYETLLIQSPATRHSEFADRIVRRVEGVVIARGYSLLEYNIPRVKLAEAQTITPGFNSPTVSSLEDSAWCAIRAMVKRSEVITIMERLESLGASAIMEMRITNCRL